MIKATGLLATCVLAITLVGGVVRAESAWVSDRFEITLRSGPSTTNAIQLMLGSGTEVEVLEVDAESGYTLVRTGGGTEGWVLTRYLMDEAGAREQLAALTSQLTSEASRGSSLNSQLAAIRGEYDTATGRIETLESENEDLSSEIAEIKRTAANVIAINNQNKDLREQIAAEEIRVATLEQENRELTSQTMRYWFMSGALVLVVGMVLGLWLPRIRWQRRSRYDRF